MDQAPAYKTLGDAQDALIKALDRKRELEGEISAHRELIADSKERIQQHEQELRVWGDEAKKALAVVAMGFRMTVKEDDA
jgi:ABC-type Fe3+-citrate transport system substrate-binding protein